MAVRSVRFKSNGDVIHPETTANIVGLTQLNENGTNKTVQQWIDEQGTSTMSFVYECNGVNDNLILSQMCEEFFTNYSMYNTARLAVYVVGTFGITEEPVSTLDNTLGSEWVTWFYLSSDTYAGNNRIVFDFKNAIIPEFDYSIDPSVTEFYFSLFYIDSNFITIKNMSICTNFIQTLAASDIQSYISYGEGNYDNCDIEFQLTNTGSGGFAYAVLGCLGLMSNNISNTNIVVSRGYTVMGVNGDCIGIEGGIISDCTVELNPGAHMAGYVRGIHVTTSSKAFNCQAFVTNGNSNAQYTNDAGIYIEGGVCENSYGAVSSGAGTGIVSYGNPSTYVRNCTSSSSSASNLYGFYTNGGTYENCLAYLSETINNNIYGFYNTGNSTKFTRCTSSVSVASGNTS